MYHLLYMYTEKYWNNVYCQSYYLSIVHISKFKKNIHIFYNKIVDYIIISINIWFFPSKKRFFLTIWTDKLSMKPANKPWGIHNNPDATGV